MIGFKFSFKPSQHIRTVSHPLHYNSLHICRSNFNDTVLAKSVKLKFVYFIRIENKDDRKTLHYDVS